MFTKLEQLIKAVYKKWKSDNRAASPVHPDEEAWACFLEGKLPQEENKRMKLHLISCSSCAEILATCIKLKPDSLKAMPHELVERAKDLSVSEDKTPFAQIAILLKEKVLEILSTTGDILVGEEFVPAPVLRSRQIKDFKDEVTILKDFDDIRAEIKIENKLGEAFDLIIFIKDKETHCIIKDLRVTLLKDGLELESYISGTDKITFEHVLAGKYTVEISNIENKIAVILLDIRR